MFTRKRLIISILTVALPFLLEVMWNLFPAIGAVPYLAYQLYYAPLGLWLGEPLFGHDSELGILVHAIGAVATALFYVIVIICVSEVVTRFRIRAAD